MERNILIFIEDANGNQVNGVDVDFFVNGASIGSAKSAQGRGSIQVKDTSAQIEVRIAYKGHTDSVKLSEGQDSYTFTLPIPIIVEGPWYKENSPAIVGLILLLLGIFLGFSDDNPTNFQKQLIMILVSLGAGGVASIIPGFLKLNLDLGKKLVVSAAGAIAVFVLIFFYQPAIFEENASAHGDTVLEQPE